ncbi:MAG TPA: hypothetical protein VIV12_26605 [Streptosporangiaceae bacterium]
MVVHQGDVGEPGSYLSRHQRFQVSSPRSMFSHHYLGMYVAVVALIVVGAVLSLALWVQQRRIS